MIIASILLSRKDSFLQAMVVTLLLSSIVIGEYSGFLQHYCLKNFTGIDQVRNTRYISGVIFVFTSTIFIAVYMATSITKRLREQEGKLKQANLLLEENDRIKSEYVLRVTHDIKEHLSAIQGCIEPVIEEFTGPLSQSQKDLLSRADQRIEKLTFFVKALLEITRIKLSKHIEMDYFSLTQAITNAVNLVEARAKDKDILLSCDIAPQIARIKGAQIYIEETIANILANSIKYTPRGGKVNISVKDLGENIFIQIIDTGIGIPKDEIPMVFQEFFRASNARETERTGTGLGLSIAKQVVLRHKGRIWLESELGKGTQINIELPK